MSSYHYLFLRPWRNPARLVEDLGELLGVGFERVHYPYADFIGEVGQVVVDVALTHGFGMEPRHEDREMPLSRYPVCLTFRYRGTGTSRHEEAEVAWRVYEGLGSLEGYDLLLVYDFQQVLAASPPLASRQAP
ncbi:hypothetical protein [Nonomuraea sp. NPDC050783]|uniref:hypothetical protein n=1 Tax=Nonomuraea sp. NPDC050783 TaxID=3154634 RepID=UPI003465FC51